MNVCVLCTANAPYVQEDKGVCTTMLLRPAGGLPVHPGNLTGGNHWKSKV